MGADKYLVRSIDDCRGEWCRFGGSGAAGDTNHCQRRDEGDIGRLIAFKKKRKAMSGTRKIAGD